MASDWSLLFTGNKHLIKINSNITCYEFNKIFSHIAQHSKEIEQDRKIEGWVEQERDMWEIVGFRVLKKMRWRLGKRFRRKTKGRGGRATWESGIARGTRLELIWETVPCEMQHMCWLGASRVPPEAAWLRFEGFPNQPGDLRYRLNQYSSFSQPSKSNILLITFLQRFRLESLSCLFCKIWNYK